MKSRMLAVALCGLVAWTVRAGTPEEEFEAAFGVDLVTARSTAATTDDVALAERVLDKARASANDPPLQAYLCARAAEIAAVGVEGIPVVARVVETMAPLSPAARSPV